MNQKPAAREGRNHRFQKIVSPITLVLIAILLSASWLSARPVRVTAAKTQISAVLQANPTPVPQPASGDSSPQVSPLVGILVLLAPLAFLVWKSRGAKEPKITSACCLPVIDENKRPFQTFENEPVSQTPTKEESGPG